MNAKETATYLRRFNKWRRGEDERLMDEAGIHPKEAGQRIDDAIALLEQVEDLEKERDRLRAIFYESPEMTFDDVKRLFKAELAEHDAQVIENWLKRLPDSNRAVRLSDVRKSAQDYANQLRQKAQEVAE